MILDSASARLWRWIGLGLSAAAAASFAWVWMDGDYLHGGSPAGLAYGIAALVLTGVLLAFGVRKRAYRSRLGKLETWLHSHVWLGLLTLLLVVFHTGLRFRDGLAVAAFAVMAAVVVSGIVGVMLYSVVPRLLTDVGSNPPPEASSAELAKLDRAMARLASGRSPAFQRVHARLRKESLPGALAGWRLLFGRKRFLGTPALTAPLKRLVAEVEPEEEEPLRQLLVLSRQSKELHQRLAHQQYYRNWLDIWLWVHLPLSLALVVLVAAHVVAAAYYGGVLETLSGMPGR